MRVGVVGAGQLARMTYQAGISLGLTVRLLATSPEESAALVGREVAIGSPTSGPDLDAFAATCDVVTFDHELVDATHLGALERAGHTVRPGAEVVALVQDKRRQRTTLSRLGLPLPEFRFVSTADEIAACGAEWGWPVVVKAARGGYDGRGVWVVPHPEGAAALVRETAARGVELLAEQWVPIEREVAVLVARRPSGEARVYPVVETVQRDGICHELLAPAPLSPALAGEARDLGLAVAEACGVTGILAVELFVAGGRLLVNELAARPHNSGHFSIEGSITSQFENHLRAVLDWPLGDPSLAAPAVATVNILGRSSLDPALALPQALAVPGVHVHLYGKPARPGRKLGHVTATGDDAADARARAREATEILAGGEAE
ncbi:MAG TPA: 5-(carboxyamino)imidazole ribonucleotide synthase [Chloroflexota bacterium]|nr:5-(carboxyamino)imidazole ribonucleotide synthase [Chloroflexota bacterium]